jgi:hypothetical protein
VELHLLEGEVRLDLTGSLVGRYQDSGKICRIRNIKKLKLTTTLESYVDGHMVYFGAWPPQFQKMKKNLIDPIAKTVDLGKATSEHRVPCGVRCDCAPSQSQSSGG